MNLVHNIQFALNNPNPVTEMYIWLVNRLDIPATISKLMNGYNKVVLVQFDRHECLPSGKLVTEMFDNIGVSILQSFFGAIKIYRRRKPYHSGDGTTNLSTDIYQIVCSR